MTDQCKIFSHNCINMDPKICILMVVKLLFLMTKVGNSKERIDGY